MNWYSGQKVVCVDDSNQEPDDPKLVKGRIYTIRRSAFWERGWSNSGPHIGVWLNEIYRMGSVAATNIEYPYSCHRFRPLDDDKLKGFRAMLKKTEAQNRKELHESLKKKQDAHKELEKVV